MKLVKVWDNGFYVDQETPDMFLCEDSKLEEGLCKLLTRKDVNPCNLPKLIETGYANFSRQGNGNLQIDIEDVPFL